MTLKELEAALGMPLAEAKTLLAASKKPDPAKTVKLTGAELRMTKMEALMTRGVQSNKIPVILNHLNITGETAAEIDASIDALISAGIMSIDSGQGGQGQGQGAGQGQGGQGQGQQGGGGNANGAGNQGIQQQNGGKKIWTAAEVRELRYNGGLTDEILADLKKAESEGRVKA